MIEDIEQFDSEMIATRNNKKEVFWDDYKKFHEKKWHTEVTSSELKNLFYSFSKGFVNGHSHFVFLHSGGKKDIIDNLYNSNIKIGFTYPENTFFDLDTGEKIIKINS